MPAAVVHHVNNTVLRAGDGITDSVCRDCNETFPTLSKFSLHAYLCREKRKIKEEESVEVRV